MLKISAVSKSYGPDLVLQNVSFVLNKGERVGLVGPNGSGKSTLLRLVAGALRPDSGSVWLDPADSVAYLPQYPLDELHLSIREAVLRGSRVGELKSRLAELEQALAEVQGDRLEGLMADYAAAQEEFERLGGYQLEARLEEVIQGLALDVPDLDAPVSVLSGGNKTKLSLARLLLSGASILLLDEPTNYLDLPALLWLERFVNQGDRAYIIVSHDRRFLDRTVSSILELDAARHSLRQWPGNYSDYMEARLKEEQKRLEAYQDQQEEIARIEEDIRRTREQARKNDALTQGDYKGKGVSRARLGYDRAMAAKVARKAKVRERKLERKLAGPDLIEKPVRGWGLHLADLGRNPIEDNRTVLEVENLHAGYDGREVLRGVSLTLRGRDRLALLGGNGSGKSTLLRCISGGIPYQGSVRLGPRIRPGVLSQEAEELPLDRSVLDIFRARTEMYEDEARTYLHKFLFKGEEVFKPVRSLSYGQRAKLALGILILSDANFLMLDEPTSHMDMPALEAIERALAEYVGPLLLVSHDRYFLSQIGVTRVEVLDKGVLRSVESVEDYESELTRGE